MKAGLLFVLLLAVGISLIEAEQYTFPWYRGIGDTQNPFTITVYDGDEISWYMVDDFHTVTSVDALNSTQGSGRYFSFGSPAAPLRENQTTPGFYVNSSALPQRVYYYDEINGFDSMSAQLIVRPALAPTPTATAAPSLSASAVPTPSASVAPSLSPSTSLSPTVSPTPTASPTASPTFCPTPSPSICPPPPPSRAPVPNPACYLRPNSYAAPPLDVQVNFYFADILAE
eukprot:TRINITY_DN3391_c0_g2_i1.p1 TRINITY_DN3391_c0_g2~~TRINITY_DN3391_c0_g2_i1.p1  ORF type:complete len:229 (+),score=54.38 TRINITY_DN3391_c0_g2_i1:39-725(+)